MMQFEDSIASCKTCLMLKKHGWCPLSNICVYAPKGILEPLFNRSICPYSSNVQESWEFRGPIFGCQSMISLQFSFLIEILVSTATFLLVLFFSIFIVVLFSFIFCLCHFSHKYNQQGDKMNYLRQPLLSSCKGISCYDSLQDSPICALGPDYTYLPFRRGSIYYDKQKPSENATSMMNYMKGKCTWKRQRQLLLGKPADNVN
ncbi:hypothetical protein PORY_002162 [Pneumocystis oryctolagi]|uniref:Uncharacterized protein n=1 Tax=Pneumocystis oryctolagi TaxID=42067 RepID=A0ACB7CD83_9ASCO|nr:hypothetical protein PORY_002162 [Pneumocystis oryctolagi]